MLLLFRRWKLDGFAPRLTNLYSAIEHLPGRNGVCMLEELVADGPVFGRNRYPRAFRAASAAVEQRPVHSTLLVRGHERGSKFGELNFRDNPRVISCVHNWDGGLSGGLIDP